MKTPVNLGILQSDIDFNGFNALNVGGGIGAPARKFDVKTYGAIGDGTTDDTTAIQAALADIPTTGGVLYFPAGNYKYTGATLTLSNPTTVEGDGGSIYDTDTWPPVSGEYSKAISVITFNSATGSLFTVEAHGCTFKNIALCNSSVTPPSDGAGITVVSGGTFNNYTDMSVSGFYIGIDVQSGAEQRFDNCVVISPVLYGLKLRNILVPDAGDYRISNCTFWNSWERSATSAIRIESGGGPKIMNCKINSLGVPTYAFANGIDLSVASGVATVDFLIANCSIEAFSGVGIKGTTGAGAVWKNILLTGNQISPYVAGNPFGINLDASNGTFDIITILGCQGLAAPSSSNPFISLTNCTNVVTTGNAQVGYSALGP